VLLAFLAVFTIVDRMSAPDGGRRTAAAPPGAVTLEPDTSAAATTTTAPPTTTTRPTTTTAPPTTKRATEPTLRPAGGVTVQVLNGVWVTGLAHRVASQVRTAGYDVVAAKTALGSYSVSRVYYTGGHRGDAEAPRAVSAFARSSWPGQPVAPGRPPAVIGKDYPGV
jgi:hypothetical protein